MNKFIEVTDIHRNSYIINTNWIVYVEKLFNNESKTLIVLDKEIPICKYGELKDPRSLYVIDEYNSIRDRLI